MGSKEALFTDIEIDAIGEILNISLGSSATSISSMLDKRVNITTPRVEIMQSADFQFKSYEPAIGVEITYVSGLSGTNVMILKESDVKVIVDLLLGTEDNGEEFVMDEMSISAVCEVMNQMMGASSTALSQFLSRPINISTPATFSIEDSDTFKQKYYSGDSVIVTVYFRLMIEDLIDSEFISVMTVDLARELISLFDMSMGEGEAQPAPAPAVQAASQAQDNPRRREEEPQEEHEVRRVVLESYDMEAPRQLSEDQSDNLGLIMNVPLQITVEIGRTKRQIKDILELSSGTIVELNKQAGSPVDIYVNGQPIAKGDVVVVDDFYGVRVTEILSGSEIMKMI